jgi:hypothetical protein
MLSDAQAADAHGKAVRSFFHLLVGEPPAEKVCAWVAGMLGSSLIQQTVERNAGIGQMQRDSRIIVLEPRPGLGNIGEPSGGVRRHRIVSFCCTCAEDKSSLIIVQNVMDPQVSLFLFDFKFQISDCHAHLFQTSLKCLLEARLRKSEQNKIQKDARSASKL